MSFLNSNALVENHQLKVKKVVLDINAGTSGFNCSNIGDITVTATAAASGEYTIGLSALGDVYKCWEIRVISDTDSTAFTASIASNVLSIAANSDGDLSSSHQDLVIEVTYELI